MPNGLISILTATGAVLIAALIAALLSRGKVRWGWLMASIALLLAHDAAVTGAWRLVDLPNYGDDWNWSGKVLALVLCLMIAAIPALGWKRSGLTLRQNGLLPALAFSIAIAALFLVLAFYFPGEGANAEAFAFQLTMPGLEEEIFYRGILLLMLNEAFGRPVTILGARMGWAAVLTSLAFGLDHALGYGADGFSFDPMTLALTALPVLPLVWLRERTGSVLLPILLHNYANTVFMIV